MTEDRTMKKIAHVAANALLPLLVAQGLSAEASIVPAIPSKDVPTLECSARYTLEGSSSPAMDIRWVDKNSVMILRATEGAHVHSLEEGLPSENEILPSLRGKSDGVPGPYFILATSGNIEMATGLGFFVWREEGSEPRVMRRGGFYDLDLDGDRVAILGIPGEEWKSAPGAYVWTGTIDENDIHDFEPILQDPDAKDDPKTWYKRYNPVFHALAGSLRFLDNGDLFVFPGYEPKAYLLSRTGKVEEIWSLEELGVASEKAAEHLRRASNTERSEGSSIARLRTWNQTPVIDEVLAFKRTPGLILRTTGDGEPVWHLAILRVDETEWFRIPVQNPDEGARLRGDVNKRGEIVLLVGDRAYHVGDEEEFGQQVMVCDPYS